MTPARHIRTPFMDPLVRAIAAGDKLVTRRLIKLPRLPDGDSYPADWAEHAWAVVNEDDPHLVVPAIHGGRPNLLSVPMRAAPGDVMDVCEALVPEQPTESAPFEWASYRSDGWPVLRHTGNVVVEVGAPTALSLAQWECVAWPWKVRTLPARYCPAWAIRHHRRLISVRPERLSDVTDAEAVLEGIRYLGWPETREGFIEGFCKMHKLDSDSVWVERREWARGEVKDV